MFVRVTMCDDTTGTVSNIRNVGFEKFQDFCSLLRCDQTPKKCPPRWELAFCFVRLFVVGLVGRCDADRGSKDGLSGEQEGAS
jgi:hypothetical protein